MERTLRALWTDSLPVLLQAGRESAPATPLTPPPTATRMKRAASSCGACERQRHLVPPLRETGGKDRGAGGVPRGTRRARRSLFLHPASAGGVHGDPSTFNPKPSLHFRRVPCGTRRALSQVHRGTRHEFGQAISAPSVILEGASTMPLACPSSGRCPSLALNSGRKCGGGTSRYTESAAIPSCRRISAPSVIHPDFFSHRARYFAPDSPIQCFSSFSTPPHFRGIPTAAFGSFRPSFSLGNVAAFGSCVSFLCFDA